MFHSFLKLSGMMFAQNDTKVTRRINYLLNEKSWILANKKKIYITFWILSFYFCYNKDQFNTPLNIWFCSFCPGK